MKNEKIDEVINDVRAYYNENCRLENLVEDADEMFSGWYEHRNDKKISISDGDGIPQCLLEKLLHVSRQCLQKSFVYKKTVYLLKFF